MKIAIFIDFQGTIGGEGTDDITSLQLYDFSADSIRRLNKLNVLVIGITNQSNISKGALSWNDYHSELERIKIELKESHAFFDEVYCCPHTDDDHCDCKKPRTGMIQMACSTFSIDLKNSYVIGDMGMSDMVLAKKIGAKGILVQTGVGWGSIHEYRHTWSDCDPYIIVPTLADAVYIIEKEINQKHPLIQALPI